MSEEISNVIERMCRTFTETLPDGTERWEITKWENLSDDNIHVYHFNDKSTNTVLVITRDFTFKGPLEWACDSISWLNTDERLYIGKQFKKFKNKEFTDNSHDSNDDRDMGLKNLSLIY